MKMNPGRLREAFRKIGSIITATPYWPIAAALGMMVFFAPHEDWHGDLIAFRNYPEELWHPYWAKWLFSLLTFPPEIIAYIALSIISILSFYFASQVFEGRTWVIFLSFPFSWTLYYGQIDSIVIAGLALAFWALKSERGFWMGVGFVLASIKPQLALPLALTIYYWSSDRIRALIVPVIVFIISLIQWGFWIPDWVLQLFNTEYLTSLSRNMSLWTVIGPFVFLAWIPVVFVDLPRWRKVILIAATTAATMPYFPLPSLVLLLVMPVPAWVWALSFLPAIGMLFTFDVYGVVSLLVPPAIYIWAVWPSLQPVIQKGMGYLRKGDSIH